jgi:hypothetical protein
MGQVLSSDSRVSGDLELPSTIADTLPFLRVFFFLLTLFLVRQKRKKKLSPKRRLKKKW